MINFLVLIDALDNAPMWPIYYNAITIAAIAPASVALKVTAILTYGDCRLTLLGILPRLDHESIHPFIHHLAIVGLSR